MGRQPLIRWASRVQPAKVRQLYELERSGVYDEDLLVEVGWGLHARCRDALTVWRAVCKGELPCPQCGEPVRRPARKSWVKGGTVPAGAMGFACPACAEVLTWRECRDALRREPKCLRCGRALTWQYEHNRLRCDGCGAEWTWQKYRRSITARVWLPCANCGKKIRRPREGAAPAGQTGRRAEPEQAECPECGALASHAKGMLSCERCGYEASWADYRKRMRRRAERLRCSSCGFRFTWHSWRASYLEQDLFTGGGVEPLREFAAVWETCKAPRRQMILIDVLLHAVHGQGALAPVLIEADECSVMQFLDELAQAK